MSGRALLWVLLLCAPFALFAQTPWAGLEGEELARFHALNAELRCVICQNRSIAESDAPLAKDLREIVARQIAAGRSDAQIKQYLVDRYGEWVLYEPPLDSGTVILWAGPFVLLAIALVTVGVILRRRSAAPTATPSLDRERLARVLGDPRRESVADDAAHDDPSRDRS